MRNIKFNKLLMAGLLMVLFLSIGIAFATEDTALNDGNNAFQDSIDDADSNLMVNDEIQEIDEELDEVDADPVQSVDCDDPLKGREYIDYSPKSIIVSGDTFDDVQNAIDSANDGDEIIVFSANGNGSQIIVNKSITIRGVGNTSTLDARNLSRIFCILSDNVVIKNLNLINGFQNDSIFIDYFQDSSGNYGITIRDDSSMDSNLIGKGGAIKWVGNNGKLINCSLTNNALKDVRQTYIAKGKVISWIGKNGIIINSTFANNKYDPTIEDVVGNTNSHCYVIEKVIHGVYFGDLCENVFFKEVAVNSDPAFDLKNVSTYYKSGDMVSFSLKANEVNCVNETVAITISKGEYKYTFNATTDSNGLVRFKIPANLTIGKYVLKVEYDGDDYNSSATSSIIVKKIPAKVSLSKYSAIYNSGKKFTIKLINSKTNKAFSNQRLILKVYTGKAYKTYKVKTDKNGKASLDLSKASAGKHKIIISGNKNVDLSKTATITISKAKAMVKLSKNAFKYKKADKLKVTVTDKKTKKPIKNTKVTVKVYTGKEYKTYKLKTNQKGIIQINTKNLKKGIHKININSKGGNYIITKNTSIKVK